MGETPEPYPLPDTPTTEGGVWGSYYGYLHDLQDAAVRRGEQIKGLLLDLEEARAGQAATPDGPRRWALPDDAEATARIVVVVNRRRGSVHGMTADNAEAQRWTRELIDSYRDELAATQYVGLVKVGPGSLFVDALTDATPADESTGGAG